MAEEQRMYEGISCNIHPETLEWNRRCLETNKPICNVSEDTLRWNQACLDYANSQKQKAPQSP